MVAGAQYRGQFEQRFKDALEEVVASAGKVVLFVDELHTILGAGNAEGAMDAANMLKPLLARGELRMIGATTLAEYRRSSATPRWPGASPRHRRGADVEETVDILRGLARATRATTTWSSPTRRSRRGPVVGPLHLRSTACPTRPIDLSTRPARGPRCREASRSTD
jgi:hypothetical protein